MSGIRVRYLFFRHFHKTASSAEQEELMMLIRSGEYQQDLKSCILEALRLEKGDPKLSEDSANKILNSILKTPTSSVADQDPPVENNGSVVVRLRMLVAASLVAALSLAGYYLLVRQQSPFEGTAKSATVPADVAPGKDKAYLSLSDGTSVDLENQEMTPLLSARGISNDSENGELVYHRASGSSGFSTLTTPMGGQYKITLPDGSKAWLNAGSSLKFPNAFGSDYRAVEMSGEVYFEIATDRSKPFLVTIKGNRKDTEVKVLGTHFNVSSYADEPELKTTLLEGSVEISQQGVSRRLKPGQQAQIPQDADGKNIKVKSVDADAAVAWKEGRFEFNDNIRDIMRQIARWYDVEVTYEGNVDGKSFAGVIPRKKNVSEVLQMMELTGGIHFSIEGRTIIVKTVPI